MFPHSFTFSGHKLQSCCGFCLWVTLTRKQAWLLCLDAAQNEHECRFDMKRWSFITLSTSVLRHASHCKLPHFTPQMGCRNARSASALGYLWLPSGFTALTLEPDSSCVEAGPHNRDAFCFWSTALNIAQRAPSQEPDWFIQTERIKMPNRGKPSWVPDSLSAEGRWEK